MRGGCGRAALIPLGAVVLAFMALSLAITGTGTARFAVAMGYPVEVGYVVGAVFDLAKALLPVALLVLLARRAFALFAIIGAAWAGLLTYSCLATHATVSSAIAAIERTGNWKMEGRSDAKAELDETEKRLAVLAQPTPPRPSKTLTEALASESVPSGVWRDSRECQDIRGSRYFQSACQRFLALRRELAAAEDYEQLNARARELRQSLAAAPPVATTDPLPEAFAATLGRFLPGDGHGGIALLLTLVVEIMSCFGLAGLRALGGGTTRGEGPAGEALSSLHGERLHLVAAEGGVPRVEHGRAAIVPMSSLTRTGAGVSPRRKLATDRQHDAPSTLLPKRRAGSQAIRIRDVSCPRNSRPRTASY